MNNCFFQPACSWIESDKPSIIVSGNEGQFGNKMYDYVALLGFKLRLNASVFMPDEGLDMLKEVFANLEIKSAEENVCHFAQDIETYKETRHKLQVLKMKKHIEDLYQIELKIDHDGMLLVPEDLHEKHHLEVIHNDDFRSSLKGVDQFGQVSIAVQI